MAKTKEFNIDLLNLENKIIRKKKIKTYLPEFNIFLKVAIDLEIDFQLVAQYEKIVQLYINYLPEIKKIITLLVVLAAAPRETRSQINFRLLKGWRKFIFSG